MKTQTTCSDCGVGIGTPHLDDCDVALCLFCGQQRITCDCPTTGQSVWTGKWPTTQPNRELFELRGKTWYLRNIHGPLARVNRHGHVRSGRTEE